MIAVGMGEEKEFVFILFKFFPFDPSRARMLALIKDEHGIIDTYHKAAVIKVFYAYVHFIFLIVLSLGYGMNI